MVWSREGVIYRITPRQNDAVNDTWMADSGGCCTSRCGDASRLESHPCRTEPLRTWKRPSRQPATCWPAGGVAVVGSGRSTVEEQFLTRKLAEAVEGAGLVLSRVGEGDGLLVSADRNPNVRGALVTGLSRPSVSGCSTRSGRRSIPEQ